MGVGQPGLLKAIQKRFKLIILFTLIGAFGGFIFRALEFSVYEVQSRLFLSETQRGCVDDDPSNMPLFETAALALPTSDEVLNATIDSLKLSDQVKDLREGISTEKDEMGLIAIYVRHRDASLTKRIALTITEQSIVEFGKIDQTTGAMRRMCNKLQIGRINNDSLSAKLVETDISFVPLMTALAGCVLGMAIALFRRSEPK